MSLASSISAVLVAGAVMAMPSLAAELDPAGQWEVTTGESRYRVSHCGEDLCAKLTWLRDDARTDENVALLNKTIVRGAPADDNKWQGTVTFEGQSYDATVTLVSNDSMRIHGCSGVFCRSFELTRI